MPAQLCPKTSSQYLSQKWSDVLTVHEKFHGGGDDFKIFFKKEKNLHWDTWLCIKSSKSISRINGVKVQNGKHLWRGRNLSDRYYWNTDRSAVRSKHWRNDSYFQKLGHHLSLVCVFSIPSCIIQISAVSLTSPTPFAQCCSCIGVWSNEKARVNAVVSSTCG